MDYAALLFGLMFIAYFIFTAKKIYNDWTLGLSQVKDKGYWSWLIPASFTLGLAAAGSVYFIAIAFWG